MMASIPMVPALVVVATMLTTAMEEEKGYLGVALKASDNGGLAIFEVRDDSPAAKVGLKENDRIIKLDGEAVGSLQDFVTKIGEKKPGTEIKLLIVRDTDEKEIKVKLGKFPKDTN